MWENWHLRASHQALRCSPINYNLIRWGCFYLRALCAQSLIARPFNAFTAHSKRYRKPLQRDMYEHLSRALSDLDLIKNMHMAAPDISAKCETSLGFVSLRDLHPTGRSCESVPLWITASRQIYRGRHSAWQLRVAPLAKTLSGHDNCVPSANTKDMDGFDPRQHHFWSWFGSWQCTSLIVHQGCTFFQWIWSPSIHHEKNSCFGIESGWRYLFFVALQTLLIKASRQVLVLFSEPATPCPLRRLIRHMSCLQKDRGFVMTPRLFPRARLRQQLKEATRFQPWPNLVPSGAFVAVWVAPGFSPRPHVCLLGTHCGGEEQKWNVFRERYQAWTDYLGRQVDSPWDVSPSENRKRQSRMNSPWDVSQRQVHVRASRTMKHPRVENWREVFGQFWFPLWPTAWITVSGTWALSCDIAGAIFYHDQFRQYINGIAWLRKLCSCIGEYFLANLRSGRFFSFAQQPRQRKTHRVHVALAFKGAFKQGLSGETARRIRSWILEFPELTCQPEVGNPAVNGSKWDSWIPWADMSAWGRKSRSERFGVWHDFSEINQPLAWSGEWR